MPSELTKLAAYMSHMGKPCSCGSGKTAKVCGCRHEKGSEIEKLSARFKPKCQHCGVKHAFSITDAGHKLDARQYRVLADAIADMRDANADYRKVHPLLAVLSGRGEGRDRNLRHHQRHMDYSARQHEQGENAYNPFGGAFTESRQELGRGGGEKKSALSQRSEPMKPAVRRDRPEAYYPQPTKVAQLREVQKLREKIAVAPLVAPLVAAGTRYFAAKAAPMALNASMNAMTAGPGAGNKLRAAAAGAATGAMPGSGIASQLAGAAAQPTVNRALGVR